MGAPRPRRPWAAIEAERCCGEPKTVLPRTQNGLASDSKRQAASPVEWALFFGAGLVPGEGFEPPTFGLQNRCSTAELTRQINGLGNGRRPAWQPTWQSTLQQISQ
jgi:hypothetical protein